MGKEKLRSLKAVRPQLEIDSVKRAEARGDRRAFDVLMEAQRFWSCMDKFRRDRERNKRYCYGEQWGDVIKTDMGSMTEEEYIGAQDNVALCNNLIHRLVRNVIGVYLSQAKEPTCMARDREEQVSAETMSTLLQYNMQVNKRKEIDPRGLEEFLISGLVVYRKWSGWLNNKMDCWTTYVQPNRFFIDNNTKDFRGWDVSCVGEVHDIGFNELAQRFAKSPQDYARLANIYKSAADVSRIAAACNYFGYSRLQNYDFLFTEDPTRCRVIEVWRKETKPRYRCHDYNTGEFFKIDESDYAVMVEAKNKERLAMADEVGLAPADVPLIHAEWFVDDLWYYYFLTPFGDILEEGETPYLHKGHPYVFKAYPFIDGEIHSFVSEVIDQQRYVNRLVTLYDWIMRASAKGVLLFPEECLPTGTSLEDIADEWSRFNGVIAIKAKPGVPLPQQVSNNSTNIGISELLNIQMKFFEDISGVNGALQGKPGYSGTSGSLYSQQTQNATTSLLDTLETFSQFLVEGAYKDIKNIQQFYDDDKVMKIAGQKGHGHVNPQEVKDAEYDLSVVESTATPVYRAMANDFLVQLWQGQAITIEELLEHGEFPFGDALLQSIRARKEKEAQSALGGPNASPSFGQDEALLRQFVGKT